MSREPDPSCTGSGPSGFDPERTTLREWVAGRHEYLHSELQRVTRELREIGAVARALSLTSPVKPATTYGRSDHGTIKGAALAALIATPEGMTSADLRPIIEAALGRQFTRESIAPQLSRLKAAGLLSHENGQWFATASAIEARSDATVKQGAAEGESASDAQSPTP